MKILKLTENTKEQVLQKAIEVLQNGGIIIYPTETCYGVGVDSTNKIAVSKLLKYKKRQAGKAISVAVDSIETAKKYVQINKNAKDIYAGFLPGPVTVISHNLGIVDQRLVSEKNTLGIRISSHKILWQICNLFKKPITSTSANSSGKKTPYTVKDILEELSDNQKKLIDLIIDAGELPKNPPSTVIDTTTSELSTYRQGLYKIENLSQKADVFESNSLLDSDAIGVKFIEKNIHKIEHGPIVLLLNGNLGAGKTHFVKSIASFLGIQEKVKSPSYGYYEEYDFFYKNTKCNLCHVDAWRIETIEDLKFLNLSQFLQPYNILCIEWPSVVLNLDPNFFAQIQKTHIDIEIYSDTKRVFTISN